METICQEYLIKMGLTSKASAMVPW